MPLDTKTLRFYHATDADSARSIVAIGFKDVLSEFGCNELMAEIWTRLRQARPEGLLIRLFGPDGSNTVDALRSVAAESEFARAM